LPADSRLEIFTEWLPETPEPERTPQPIAADEQTGRIAFADDMLRFGADTRLVRGRAFALQEQVEGGEQIQVGKQFARIEGRPMLIESVNYRELKPLLAELPRAAAPDPAFVVSVLIMDLSEGIEISLWTITLGPLQTADIFTSRGVTAQSLLQ
jgi:hypothetical protein